MLHVLVNFLLQVDADGAVCANDLIGADAGIRGNVAAWIWDFHVGGIISDGVMRALDGRGDKSLQEILADCGAGGNRLAGITMGGEGRDVRPHHTTLTDPRYSSRRAEDGATWVA